MWIDDQLGTWAATPTPLEAFKAIGVPTFLMTGTAEAAGHMAPVTHPQRVNPLIDRFLSAL